jgi:hypothetical protein
MTRQNSLPLRGMIEAVIRLMFKPNRVAGQR